MCSIYGSSGRCHGNACRINEVLVLVFNSAKCALSMVLLGVAMANACRINEVLVLVFNRGDI